VARSTSTYGKTFAPVHTVKLAEFGLCPTHKTAILSDLTCWECGPDTIPASTPAPAPAPRPTTNTATPKQMAFLKSLFAERTGNPAAMTLRDGLLAAYRSGGLTAKVASAGIDMLLTDPNFKADPKAPKVDYTVSAVADGYYAVPSSGDNDLAFYRVTSSEKWGQSVQLIVGGHADQYVRRAAVKGILDRILSATYTRSDGSEHVGPDAAGLRYADEIGTCYRCNRTLTDEASRAAGIGPVCANAE